MFGRARNHGKMFQIIVRPSLAVSSISHQNDIADRWLQVSKLRIKTMKNHRRSRIRTNPRRTSHCRNLHANNWRQNIIAKRKLGNILENDDHSRSRFFVDTGCDLSVAILFKVAYLCLNGFNFIQ